MNYFDKIHDYFENEMTAEEREHFELELLDNEELMKEFDTYRDIAVLTKRLSEWKTFSVQDSGIPSAGLGKWLFNQLFKYIFFVIGGVVIILVVYLLSPPTEINEPSGNDKKEDDTHQIEDKSISLPLNEIKPKSPGLNSKKNKQIKIKNQVINDTQMPRDLIDNKYFSDQLTYKNKIIESIENLKKKINVNLFDSTILEIKFIKPDPEKPVLVYVKGGRLKESVCSQIINEITPKGKEFDLVIGFEFEDLKCYQEVIDDYYLSAHEVTLGQFEQFKKISDRYFPAEESLSIPKAYSQYERTRRGFLGLKPKYYYVMNRNKNKKRKLTIRTPLDKNLPAYHITWEEALEYCNWLSVKEGFQKVYEINEKKDSSYEYQFTKRFLLGPRKKFIRKIYTKQVTINFAANGYRLPTEAEWVYAAQGGDVGCNCKFNIKNPWQIDTIRPVGCKMPNELGLFDIEGNVDEFCESEIHCFLNGPSKREIHPLTGVERQSYCLRIQRSKLYPSILEPLGTGFRVARNK